MKENFLHFIWQFQYFNKQLLTTIDGEKVQIIDQGFLNINSGPDFSNSKIKIGDLEWCGNVEIHIKSSDWNNHSHQNDSAYENVVLHVVWLDDRPVLRKDKTKIPTIELRGKVEDSLINKYTSIIKSHFRIPCENHFAQVGDIQKLSMLDKVLMKRLNDKANKIKEILLRNNFDWEETAYAVLAKNLGFKINAEPFFRLSQVLPFKILCRHRKDIIQLEALLFGQAGLLEENFVDAYPQLLKKEYAYLAHKYSLSENKLSASEWKFSKLRPANFPTIRIAEFAAILQKISGLFSSFIEFENNDEVYTSFKIMQSDYWREHYVFDKKAEKKTAVLGISSIQNIIINTIVPLLILYSKEKDNHNYQDKAMRLLESVPFEKNTITAMWQSLGLKMASAFDSQASIELYNNYCKNKLCLSCNIGVSIVRP